MARHAHATRSGRDGQDQAAPPPSSKANKQRLVKQVFRDASRRLLKRKAAQEEGDIELPSTSPAKPRRASETPTAATATAATATAATATAATATAAIESASATRKIIAQKLGKRKRHEMGHNAVAIHEDQSATAHDLDAPEYHIMTETSANVQPSDEMDEDDTEEEEEIDETVAEDMQKLEENFTGISQKYRLINRIGEGTFSTVYKAEQLDLPPDDDTENDDPEAEQAPFKRRKHYHARPPRFVALKKIYVTSSPTRILNELELLHELRNSAHICPLLTAFRHLDQVVAVLPYFRHLDFRLYYREFLTNDLRHYFLSLLSGLEYVHRAGIIHRDIKPTNFLYDHSQKHGVLVDFGLAERQGTDWQPCFCQEHKETRRDRFLNSYAVQQLQTRDGLSTGGFPKQDNRPSRRANRAGTRGFRAPEVLLKCTAQTTKIDVWSAGVILLTLLGRRFPFFNSADDIDAMIEIASIFGRKKMQAVAAMHGSVFETNIETIGEKGFSLEKIVLWASCREKTDDRLHIGEEQAVDLLTGLLDLDPNKRLSARQALEHDFFTNPIEDEAEKAWREAQEAEDEEAALAFEKQAKEKARRRALRSQEQMA